MTCSFEMVGLPGAGKTTFVKNNYATFESLTHIVQSKHPTITTKIKTRLHEALSWRHYGLPPSLRKKLAYRASFQCAYADKPVFYFDSGLAQCVLEFGIEHDPAMISHFKDIYKRLLKNTILLDYTVPSGLAAERELARVPRRFPMLGAQEIMARYPAAQKAMKAHIFPLAKAVIPVTVSSGDTLTSILKP
jgi:hypothetical protein